MERVENKRRFIRCFCVLVIYCSVSFSQNITNTLGPGGLFKIKDGSVGSFFTVFQQDGNIGIGRNINLNYTTETQPYGVIMKSGARFIHNFVAAGTNGHNTFLGVNSGNFNMSGSGTQASENTGIGSDALFSLTSGSYNTSLGSAAMNNLTSGNHNIGIGYSVMYAVTTASNNVCIGDWALSNTNSSSQNTVIGYSAAFGLNTGNNNILIGYNSSPSANNISNEITLGNSSNNKLRCNVQSITSLSDARDKKNITDLTLGLGFLCSIRPRQFNWDKREWYENSISDGSKTEGKLTAGFIAQELDEVQKQENAEWLNMVSKDNPEKWEATYGNLLPVIVKAIQELKAENDMLKNEIESLKTLAGMDVNKPVLNLETKKDVKGTADGKY